jgi:sugar phosphate isomerase/epimerase
MVHLADVTTDCASSWHLSRRDVLKHFPAMVLGGLVVRDSLASPQTPSMSFPTEPRARLSVTSYPFRSYIDSPTNRGRNPSLPGMDLTAFPAFAAEKFGISNINPLVDHFNSTDLAYLDGFRAAVDKARSRIVDLGLPGRRFYATAESVRQAAVSFGQKCVDIAAQIGSPSVRQHISGQQGEKPDVSLAAESLGKLAEYGAKRNVVINLENDSLISEDPFFLAAVIEKVNNPYLRALPDFGNSLIGHDQNYNHTAVEAMLMHVFNVCHVKDTLQGENGKQYRVDLGFMFDLAKKHSYRGFFCMEFDSGSGDPIAGTKQLVTETLQHLGKREYVPEEDIRRSSTCPKK